MKIIIFQNDRFFIFKNDIYRVVGYILNLLVFSIYFIDMGSRVLWNGDGLDGNIFSYLDVGFCCSDVVNCTAQTDYVNQNRTFI